MAGRHLRLARRRAWRGCAASVATSAISTQRSRSTADEDGVELGAGGRLGAGDADGGLGLVDGARPPRSGATT